MQTLEFAKPGHLSLRIQLQRHRGFLCCGALLSPGRSLRRSISAGPRRWPIASNSSNPETDRVDEVVAPRASLVGGVHRRAGPGWSSGFRLGDRRQILVFTPGGGIRNVRYQELLLHKQLARGGRGPRRAWRSSPRTSPGRAAPARSECGREMRRVSKSTAGRVHVVDPRQVAVSGSRMSYREDPGEVHYRSRPGRKTKAPRLFRHRERSARVELRERSPFLGGSQGAVELRHSATNSSSASFALGSSSIWRAVFSNLGWVSKSPRAAAISASSGMLSQSAYESWLSAA